MKKEVVVADDIQRSLHDRFVTAEGDEEVASFYAPAVLEDGMSNRRQRPPFIIATASCLETRHLGRRQPDISEVASRLRGLMRNPLPI
jgi:hypothetical protein